MEAYNAFMHDIQVNEPLWVAVEIAGTNDLKYLSVSLGCPIGSTSFKRVQPVSGAGVI